MFLEQLESTLRAEEDQFFSSLGRAIASWSGVETALYKMFLLCMGLPDEGTASVAYHAVINFNARLKMVDAAFALRFGDTNFSDKWRSLNLAIQRKAKLRNELAHFNVAQAFRGEVGKKLFLFPTPYDVSNDPRVSGKARKKLFTRDLAELESSFRALATEVQALTTKIHHKQKTGPFSKSPHQ